jgi:5-methyltetrahydrofolate--homocysteine methyltransferase
MQALRRRCSSDGYSRTMKPLQYTRAQALPGILAGRIAILDGAM